MTITTKKKKLLKNEKVSERARERVCVSERERDDRKSS